MKKLLSIALVLILAIVFVTPAFARGGHRGGAGTAGSTRYSVCAVEDCTLTGLHTHDGAYYCAHYYGDGHDYHEYCGIEGCELTGYHEHDGTYCFGNMTNDCYGYRRGCGGQY